MGDKTLLQAKIIVPNTIIEFLQDNIIQIAWVLEEQKGKLRLILPNRREVSLSVGRVLPWVGPHYGGSKSKDEIINIINKHKEERKNIKNHIDIVELWEMVQGEVLEESINFFAELAFGKSDSDTLAAFGHALLEQKSYFKFQNPNFEIYSRDFVEQKLENEQVLKEREVLVGSGANWLNYLWELHLKDKVYDINSQNPLEPNGELAQRLKDLLMNRIGDAQSSNDEDFWKQISKQLPSDQYLPLLLAISWGIVPRHYNYLLLATDYDTSEDFASEHIAYLHNAKNFIEKIQNVEGLERISALKMLSARMNVESLKPPKVNANSLLGQQLSQKLAKFSSESDKPKDAEEIATGMGIKIPLINVSDLDSNENLLEKYFEKDFISIDSESTTDIDDAFHISLNDAGNYDVCIALACPACIWEFAGSFDKLIMHRSTSLYLPEGTYHMMPKELSTNLFSLKEQEIRPCLLCQCTVSKQGELLSVSWDVMRSMVQDNLYYSSCEAVLNSHQEDISQEKGLDFDFITYLEKSENLEDAENLFKQIDLDSQNYEKAKKYSEMLEIAHEFAKTRLSWRIAQGAVIIEKPDLSITLTDLENEEILVGLEQTQRLPKSQLIVSELMVLANAALAEFAINHNFPLIFRTQDIVLPKEFSGVWTRPQDIAKVARCLSGASTETSPKPHTGLGLKAYSPVTSPLRRYVDLVNSAQLIYFLKNSKALWNKAELDKLLFSIHLYNDKVSLVQKMRPRYWTFVYLQQEAKRQGDRCGFKAIISDENDLFITVTLTKEQLIVRAKRHMFGEKALLGQEVMVRLGKINPLCQDVSILGVEFLE